MPQIEIKSPFATLARKNRDEGPLYHARSKESRSRAASLGSRKRIEIKSCFATLAGKNWDQGQLCCARRKESRPRAFQNLCRARLSHTCSYDLNKTKNYPVAPKPGTNTFKRSTNTKGWMAEKRIITSDCIVERHIMWTNLRTCKTVRGKRSTSKNEPTDSWG